MTFCHGSLNLPHSYHIDPKPLPPLGSLSSSVSVATLNNKEMTSRREGEINRQSRPNEWRSKRNDLTINADENQTDGRSWFRCRYPVDEISETDSLKKQKCKTWPVIGIILTISGLLTYLINPVERIQEWAMEIAPNSVFLDTWRAPPITVYNKVYIFNYTNADAFLAGYDDKLKVEEIGPFVFIESLRNTNIKFNDNGTMTYTPKRTIAFQRHLSVAEPKDQRVLMPNIAFLGLGSMLADSSMLTNLGVLPAIKYLGSKPFLNITVDDYLWGYEDPLVEAAHTIISSYIPFAKLGILDRMYDEGDNAITIRLKDNGLDPTDPGYLPKYSIDSWNGSPGLTNWGYSPDDFYEREEPLRPEKSEKCRLLKGAIDGTLFPRHLDPKVTNYVFRKSFCRHMPIVFKEKGSYMPGLTGHWYGVADNVFDTPDNNPEQLCYCSPDHQACVPKGLSDITPCYYNIPASVSFPHFYNADPKLVEAVDGLSPCKEKHGSYAVIQPELGSVVDVKTRIQTNLIMKDIKYNRDLIPLANLHLPLFWMELSTDVLPLKVVVSLYALLVLVPVFYFTSIILGIISAILLLVSFVKYLCMRTRERRIVIETVANPFVPSKITQTEVVPK